MILKGKTVLVTGASSGIGAAIAVAFAEKGTTVLVHYHSNEKGADEVLSIIKKHSDGFSYTADLSKKEEVKKLFSNIQEKIKNIDILINNAGRAKQGNIEDDKIWLHQYENILNATLYPTQEFLSVSSSSQRKIINITSVYGGLATGNPDYFQYSAFKAALNSLTTNLAKKLGNKVLVNAVAPGYTWTPPWEGSSDEEKQACTDATLIGRFISPEEIAHATIFLAENDAMTGHILTIDGGLSMCDTMHSLK